MASMNATRGIDIARPAISIPDHLGLAWLRRPSLLSESKVDWLNVKLSLMTGVAGQTLVSFSFFGESLSSSAFDFRSSAAA